MKASFLFLIAFGAAVSIQAQKKASLYFPPAGSWQHQSAASQGFDSVKLQNAVQFAILKETKRPRSMKESQVLDFGKEPFSEPIGVQADRGAPSGIIIRHGYIVAEWGEPMSVDMTHSVTKSFLSTVVGMAVDRKLIQSIQDPVSKYIDEVAVFQPGGEPQLIQPFGTEHNKRLNWDVMLRQTSDWEGTLWGKPEWADRPEKDSTKWIRKERREPGSVFEYNDVRVNALALAATWVWKRPLPEVAREFLMNPIGASSSWHWNGYSNSFIVLDGRPIQSVSGGGHWGGGLFINAYDMARFGLLSLHEGNWNGKQLLSKDWYKKATTPTSANTGYGFMNFFLNTEKKLIPGAPESAYMHVGNGVNFIYVDKEHDLVIVCRWIENLEKGNFVDKVLEAIVN